MTREDDLNLYCFNIACKNSVYNSEHCSPVSVILEIDLYNESYCSECGEELVSPVVCEVKKHIIELFKSDNNCHVTVIDDDVIYHHAVKNTLKKDFIKTKFHVNGDSALNELKNNINREETLPDLILLDLNMPGMDGWEFLKLFRILTRTLNKQIVVYVISNTVDPCDSVRLKEFPFVRSLISKTSSTVFLKNMQKNLLKRRFQSVVSF
ncbi:MAG: response regulator transcription factor [Mucilaginibacter sp.]|nr:response regulator transcription factor [Mucilaginibacter sp.]